jgi:hypothetical protein
MGRKPTMFALLYVYANPVYIAGLPTVGETASVPNQVLVNLRGRFSTGQIRDHFIPLYQSAVGRKSLFLMAM